MELRSKSKCLLPTPPVHSAAFKSDCRAGCPPQQKKKAGMPSEGKEQDDQKSEMTSRKIKGETDQGSLSRKEVTEGKTQEGLRKSGVLRDMTRECL